MPEDARPANNATESPADVARQLRLLYHARECALVAAFVREYGEEAFEIARKANYAAGMAAGREALANRETAERDLLTAAELYARVARGSPATEVSENRVVYRNDGPCGYWPIWRQAGLPLQAGCSYNGAWTEGFFHAINPRIEKSREAWRPGGDRLCVEVFELRE